MFFDNGINKLFHNFESLDSKFEILTISENSSFSFLTPEIARISLKNQGKYFLKYGYCLELDTQTVSYLASLMSGRKLEKDIVLSMNTLVAVLKQIQCDYSCFPYIFENSIKVKDNRCEKLDTLLFFEYFKNNVFNDLKYPVLNEDVLLKYAKSAEDYLTSCSQMVIDRDRICLYNIYKAIYCILLETVIIEFSTQSCLKKKLLSLFEFINNKLGVYLEREIAVCYGYLKKAYDIRNVFFKKIQINSHNLLRSLRGMAWDLTHIRILEYLTAVDISMMNTLFFHYLVSFDRGLRVILKYYPVDRILFYKTTPYIKFKYPLFDFIKEINIKSEWYKNIKSRRVLLSNVNFDNLVDTLEKQLLDL